MRARCRSKNQRTSSTATGAEWSGIRSVISGKSPLTRNRQSDEARFAKRGFRTLWRILVSTMLRPLNTQDIRREKRLQVKRNTLDRRRNIGEAHVDDYRR